MSEEITIKSCSWKCRITTGVPMLALGVVAGFIARELELLRFIKRLMFPEPKQ
jgi:hypothetical protein